MRPKAIVIKQFNTAGPSKPELHYLIDPLSRVDLPEIERLIEQQRYFVLHAPRQTGKTTALLALMEYLNAQGKYRALYANIEAAQAARNDVAEGMAAIVRTLASAALVYWQDAVAAKTAKGVLDERGVTDWVRAVLEAWSLASPRPIVLFLDEVDALVGDTLISLLRQIRAGYAQRPRAFLQTVVLCGVRDVRDYRTHSGGEIITGGLAFNIKAVSIRLGNFSPEECWALWQQHEAETGQTFARRRTSSSSTAAPASLGRTRSGSAARRCAAHPTAPAVVARARSRCGGGDSGTGSDLMAKAEAKVWELVAMIERGELRLPEMQRRYVWRAPRVRDLLDSLYRGYPSGAILLWETDEVPPLQEFAVSQQANPYQSVKLLLDGQQRLTSLSAVLRGEPVTVRGRQKPIEILFNLEHPEGLPLWTDVEENADEEEEIDEEAPDASEDELLARFNQMAFVVAAKKLEALPHWVKVSEVFKSDSDAPFLKRAGVTGFDDPRYEKYSERLKRLRAIRDYSYRLNILERTLSYEEVTEIFVDRPELLRVEAYEDFLRERRQRIAARLNDYLESTALA